jgi:hypothetical protein
VQVQESKVDSGSQLKPASCTVCSHPQREAIDHLLVAGTLSRRAIALQYGLVHTSLDRHKNNHLERRIAKAAERKQEKSDDVFMNRLEYLWDEATDGVKRAKSAARTVTDPETGELCYVGRDLGPLAPLLGQAHRNLELLGTATGRLNQTPQAAGNVYLSVIMPRAIDEARSALPEAIEVKAIEQPSTTDE